MTPPEKLLRVVHSDPIHATTESETDKEAMACELAPFRMDPKEERRLLRKLDLHIFPILVLVYTVSFLDRINISNARIQGLTEDLNLTGNRFNITLFVFFIPYILLEVPSNILIHHMRPSWYLGGLMICWGIVNMCMGFVHSYEALVALRLLLGVFEAGVVPGMIYLTSMYYKRHEYQKRISTLFCSTLIGGAFGGLLAYAISNLGGKQGLAAWRWIFIVEGAATVVIALASMFLIVDWPEQCKFLTPAEKELVRRRLESDGGDLCRMDTLNRYAYKRIFTDYKIYLTSLAFLGSGGTAYGITFFLPTILLEFNLTPQMAQVYTIPVYAATFVSTIITAWASDRVRHRYGFLLAGAFVATAGSGILLGQAGLSRGVKYMAVFLVYMGSYMGAPVSLAWMANNISGHWKRAFGSAIQVMVGNLGGIMAANIFLTQESPRYPTGYGTGFAVMWLGTISATVLVFLLAKENRDRAAGRQNWKLDRPEEEVKNMGDYHPSFRFTL